MANLYKKYMRLLDKWPVDKTKSPDLGQHIRDQVKIAFSKGEKSKIADKEQCNLDYESLNRLASNYYGNKYPHNFKKTVTGLSPEVCNAALSLEIQKELELEKLGFFARYSQRLKNIFSSKSKSSN